MTIFKEMVLVCVLGLAAFATTAAAELPRRYKVFFTYNSVELSPAALDVIERAAWNAATLQTAHIEISGYTGHEENTRTRPGLAAQRYAAVEDALAVRGVDRALFTRVALSDEIPLPAVAVRRIEIRFVEMIPQS